MEDSYYEVVGVLSAQGAGADTPGALAWRDIDQAMLAPLPAVLGRSLEVGPEQAIDEMWLQTTDGERVEEVGRVLEHTLTRLHGAADVDIIVPRELLNQRYRTQRTFSVVVGSVAALALIVGGIGIMNIMLTSVVERTHEIGIRRTVGATRRDVAIQFLTESLLMTVSGGVLGIVIGAVVSWGITALRRVEHARVGGGGPARLDRVVRGRPRVRPLPGDQSVASGARRRRAVRVGRKT